MNLVLLTVTVASLAAALTFGWIALRLRNDARRRSDARTAALAGAIDAADVVYPTAVVRLSDAPQLLFASEAGDGRTGMPMLRVGVGIAMGVALLIVVAMSNRGPATGTGDEPAAPRVIASRTAAPLELRSMRHERSGDTLTVSGLVRNPRAGMPFTRVTAIVIAFNRAGAYVASGRAGLDFTTLEPGDESPFVVTVPGALDVGRYRVSFRTEAGALQHVDRRAEQMRAAAVLE